LTGVYTDREPSTLAMPSLGLGLSRCPLIRLDDVGHSQRGRIDPTLPQPRRP